MPKVARQLRTRPPWDRMMRIHQPIQQHEYPNCHQLAKVLEVPLRTVKRDMDFMRVRLKLPIAYDPLRWGYYYTRPVDEFPSLPISEGDVFALLVARKAIEQYAGTPFQKLLQQAYAKLTGQLDAEARFTLGQLGAAFSFRPFAPEDADLKMFERLTKAVRVRREVRFLYKKLAARQAERRTVWLCHLACVENHWYLFGFDVARQAVRTFVLGRLKEVDLTGQRFVLQQKFDLNEHLRGSLGVFKGSDDYEVVIEFDAWAGDLVRGRRWHASQELTELPGGEVRLRLRLNSLEEAERWVLSWGTHATVARPKRLATRVREVAAGLVERRLRLLMDSMMFCIEGYDDVPREIHAIPEVRRFYSAFHAAWPYWLYFCNLDVDTLRAMVACCLPTLAAAQLDGQPTVLVEFQPRQLLAFLRQDFVPMNAMRERGQMFEHLIFDRTRRIFEYFNLPFDPGPQPGAEPRGPG